MPDNERLGLRYAVAAEPGQGDLEFMKDAAYAGPHLLMVTGGMENVSRTRNPSRLAIEKLRGLDSRAGSEDLATTMEGAIANLRNTFRELLADDPLWAGIGVMLTALSLRGAQMAVGHIGNGRAYVLRGGELTQMTRDHTLGQALIDEGLIEPAELGADPRYSFATRLIDGERDDSEEISVCDAQPGDRYFLVTGRVGHFISPEVLREILCDSAQSPRGVADALVGEAFPAERGDGFACVVADVLDQPRADADQAVKLAGAALR